MHSRTNRRLIIWPPDKPMKETDYFKHRVRKQRPYIKIEWCENAIDDPDYTEVQPDGRIRHWLYVEDLGKYLRVITLEDGETVHNAFPDRSFKPPEDL